MGKQKAKLNGTGKAIYATGIVLALAYLGALRVFGDKLDISPSMGGLVSFGGFLAIFMGGYLIAKAVGSEPTQNDS